MERRKRFFRFLKLISKARAALTVKNCAFDSRNPDQRAVDLLIHRQLGSFWRMSEGLWGLSHVASCAAAIIKRGERKKKFLSNQIKSLQICSYREISGRWTKKSETEQPRLCKRRHKRQMFLGPGEVIPSPRLTKLRSTKSKRIIQQKRHRQKARKISLKGRKIDSSIDSVTQSEKAREKKARRNHQHLHLLLGVSGELWKIETHKQNEKERWRWSGGRKP